MVEVDDAADPDNLVTGGAALVVFVAFVDVVFDDGYIVVSVAVVAGLVFVFIVVAVDDAGVPAVVHVDAQHFK